MGGKRPKRTRVSTGIYADKYGISIPIRGAEHRYPLGTPTDQLRDERKRLKDEAGAAPERRGTLRADSDDHLRTIPDGRPHNEQAAILNHWCAAFGDTCATLSLDAKRIKQQRAAWLTEERFSPKHLNNMLHVLRAVIRTNYPNQRNAAEDVPVLTVKYTDHRAFSDEIVDLIIDSCSDTRWPATERKPHPPINGAKLRMRAFRETGFPPAMLKRIQPHHIDQRAGTCYTEMRLKGRGVVGATVPVTKRGMRALLALRNAKLLGTFDTRSLSQAFDRGVARARLVWDTTEAGKKHPRPWPLRDNVTLYDLRHVFGTTAILENGGDLEAVATLMRHANINTTRRYLQAASDARARQTVKKLNRGGRLK